MIKIEGNGIGGGNAVKTMKAPIKEDDSILPAIYPPNFCNFSPESQQIRLSARILFSRHLKLHLGKLFKMPDDLLNKLITDCWHRLDPNA